MSWFFDSWSNLLRIAVISVTAYIGFIFLLRISGKRTLSQLNMFDFIITVAMGTTLATTILSRDTALSEGLLTLAMLILLQFIITWTSVRWQKFRHVITAEPRLVFHRGRYLEQAMRDERITDDAILEAVRKQGHGNLNEIDAVVLETNGKLSIISNVKSEAESPLANVRKE